MRKSRFTEEQITYAMRQVGARGPSDMPIGGRRLPRAGRGGLPGRSVRSRALRPPRIIAPAAARVKWGPTGFLPATANRDTEAVG